MQSTALEIGSGNGWRFRRLSKFGNFTSVDLELRQAAVKESKRFRVNHLLMNCEELGFKDRSFERIFAYDVIEHVSDLDLAVCEIARVIQKEGLLILEVPHEIAERVLLNIAPEYWNMVGHSHFLNEEKIVDLLKREGFRIKHVNRINGIIAIQLCVLFLLGGQIESQCGSMTNTNRVLNFLCGFFCENIFERRYNKYFFPIWIFTYPIGRVLSLFFPKAIHVEAVKIK